MKTKKAEQQMSASDAARCLDLRCQSKRGARLHPEDLQFIEHCWKTYPTQYAAMSDEVFRRTIPFGSRVGDA